MLIDDADWCFRKPEEPEDSSKVGIQMHSLAVKVPRKASYDYRIRPESSAEAKERASEKVLLCLSLSLACLFPLAYLPPSQSLWSLSQLSVADLYQEGHHSKRQNEIKNAPES